MRTELVTTLKRKATTLLADIKRTRRPIAITQRGIPSAYLVDAQAWESLEKRLLLLEGIARGEQAHEESRVLTQVQARRRMSRWLK